MGDLFEIVGTKSFNTDSLTDGTEYDYVTRTSQNQGVLQQTGYVNSENINEPATWSLGLLQMDFFYRRKPWYAGQFVRKIIPKIEICNNAIPFFTAILNKQKKRLLSVLVRDVDTVFENTIISLPENNGKINFEFMEKIMTQLESDRLGVLNTYLEVAGLKDCKLTAEEENALEQFEQLTWNTFNLKNLYGSATRGKRLKSSDRVLGDLPFVTAGEKDAGISAFIGNQVEIFLGNTITIDMFGSAKYRNYQYGGDDHIAVVHTENISKKSAVFITSAIHKVSHTGEFHYGRNFYAKDADNLNIVLPTVNNTPDYSKMDCIISALQKLIIQDVVAYVDDKKQTKV